MANPEPRKGPVSPLEPWRHCVAFLAAALSITLGGCTGLGSGQNQQNSPPTAPGNLTAIAVGPAQVNLSWSASTGASSITGYLVERCQGAGCLNFSQIAAPPGTTFSDTGLTGSTSYSYRARATDSAGDVSSYSSTASVATPAPTFTAPANLLAAAAGSSQIGLTWTGATEAGGTINQYLVERCQGTGCSSFTQVGASATTSFNDTGLTASTAYSYRVRATDASKDLSSYSNISSATTTAGNAPTAPGSLSATAAGPVQVNLSWSASTEAGGTISEYLLERCLGAGCSNFAQVGTSTTTSFSDVGLSAATSYSYRVRASDTANNLGPYSSIATATTAPPTIAAPTNLTASASGPTKINLVWTAATETGGTITKYLVQRCRGSGCTNFVQVGTSTTTSYADSGLTGSTTYGYRVQATDSANDLGPFSGIATATTAAPTFTAPSSLSATAASSSQINLSWSAAAEAGGTISGYLVERCPGVGCSSFAQIATPTAAVYTDSGLTASTSYAYRVRAADSSNNKSGYSNTASATTPASGPVTVTVSPVRGSLTSSQAQQFTATVTGNSNTSVTWQVDGTTGGNSTTGTISATGLFTPGTQVGMHTIIAVSVADTSSSGAATFAVTNLAGVFTYHNDLTRDGANTQEYALTPSNVNTSTFGKLTACMIDGAAYAQPLWVANLAINGGTHNVIFAATTHDSVYAFDADANPCVQYWKKSLLPSGDTWVSFGDVGTQDIYPDIGIIGTPVIDPSTNTLYVVTKSEASGSGCNPLSSCHQQLHALNLADGSEKLGGPLNITSVINVVGTGDGSSGGKVAFNTLTQNQRPGLMFLNGVVYIGWASHGDNPPYHGWVIGFSTSPSLAISTIFNANPNGSDSGIWMSGGAPAADSSGNLYVLTGNGTFDAYAGGSDYGDSTLKLSTPGLAVLDSFTPADQGSLEANDTDHGSGGAAILVNSPQGNYVIGGGKEGNYFLLNQNSLGGYTASNTGPAQIFNVGNGIFSTAAFWNNALYVVPQYSFLQAYPFNTSTGRFNTAGVAQETTSSFAFPGATPSISASSGSQNGIVWALDSSNYAGNGSTNGPAILHAFDASHVTTELWNSSQVAADQAGNAVKFTVPTIANGKVYVGTMTEITIYALKPN